MNFSKLPEDIQRKIYNYVYNSVCQQLLNCFKECELYESPLYDVPSCSPVVYVNIFTTKNIRVPVSYNTCSCSSCNEPSYDSDSDYDYDYDESYTII